MSIESINNSRTNAVLSGKTAKKDASDTKNPPALTTSGAMDDTVSLTSMPQGLRHTAESLAPEQLVNDARIAKVRAAIEDGSYVVNPERVAKKMLQFEFNTPDTT